MYKFPRWVFRRNNLATLKSSGVISREYESGKFECTVSTHYQFITMADRWADVIVCTESRLRILMEWVVRKFDGFDNAIV